MQVSVITPLFNRLELTRACAESLHRTLAGWEYEWILIDDGSTDGTRDFLRGLPDDGRTRVVLNEHPRGYAANNNVGARLARAPLLCLLNNDTLLLPGWLEPMARLARLLPDVACVGNVQREPIGGLIDHAGIYFDRDRFPQHAARGESLAPREDYLRWPAVTAACCVVRKKVFLDQGGFDEEYRNGGEDVDFCLRTATHGYRHFVANRSVIYHHVNASPGRMRHEDANQRRFRERWLADFSNGLLEPRTRALEQTVGREYLHKHRWRPWKYNFWRFCRSLEQVLSPDPPSRRLDLALRWLFRWQDYRHRRRELRTDPAAPADPSHSPVYLVVGDTAQTSNRTGVQTYVRGLAAAFGRIGAHVRLVAWRSSTRSLCLLPPEMSLGADAEALRAPAATANERSSASLFEPSAGELLDPTASLPSLHELPSGQDGAWVVLPEVFHDGQARPWIEYVRRHGWKSAVVLYDTMPNNEPRFFPLKTPHAHEAYLRAVSGADRVFPVSRFVQRDWKRFLKAKKLPETTTKVWLPGADGLSRVRTTATLSRDPAAPLRVLCISAVEPRKNLRRLLEACDFIATERPDIPFELRLVGKPHLFSEDNVPEAVRQSVERHPQKIRWIEWAEYGALAGLYHDCDFTIYPSMLEGSALPILESLWFRRPCICADTGVMKEVAAGGGCLTIDVYHARVIAEAIITLATSPKKLAALTAEIDRRPLRTWEEAAAELLAALPTGPLPKQTRRKARASGR